MAALYKGFAKINVVLILSASLFAALFRDFESDEMWRVVFGLGVSATMYLVGIIIGDDN